MKTKVLCSLLAGALLAFAAWLVHVPGNAQPQPEDGVPKKYRDTVAKGLEYLAKNQHKDGRWEGDDGKHPVAMTALVGMAFLMEGSTVEKGKYSANIRKAVDWLMSKSDAKREGLIFSDHASETDCYMYGHGLATQFLAGAYNGQTDRGRREKILKILGDAVKYIANAQSTQGGWYRTSRAEGHDLDEILATAIQIQAVSMVNHVVNNSTSNELSTNAQDYLKVAIGKLEKAAKPEQNNTRLADTAAALACRSIYMNDKLCQDWFKRRQAEIPVGPKIQLGRDELTHYYFAQAVFNDMVNAERDGGVTWKSYRTAMFDHLQSRQHKDGSWPAGDGIGIGTVYSTAVWCTILQLDTMRHPLMRERQMITR